MVDWLTTQMADFPVDYRPMFGCPTWFYNGNMFASVHGDRIMIRLSKNDQLEMMKQFDLVQPFVAVNGRTMKDYIMFPACLFSKTDELKPWFAKGFDHMTTLPLKEKKRKVKTNE